MSGGGGHPGTNDDRVRALRPARPLEGIPMKLKSVASGLALPAALAASAFLAGLPGPASAEEAAGAPYIFVPESSVVHPGDEGVRMHTYIRQLVIPGAKIQMNGPALVPGQNTPASLGCVYHIVTPTPGCNPAIATALPHGGTRTIALVDAYDDPTAATDLAKFDANNHLPPPPSFKVVFASGHRPPSGVNNGWQIEESLDVQWAHAMAPHAKLILVEANSSSGTDLYPAVTLAAKLVAMGGGGEVSDSWGGSEYSSEASSDVFFNKYSKVVVFFSTGDHFGLEYPATARTVVAVGGTKIVRNGAGAFQYEQAWRSDSGDGTGGGISKYEPRPAFQNSIASIVGTKRGVPDVAAEADPSSGVAIFVNGSIQGLWGGTSLASPLVAGIVNSAGHFETNSAAENALMYANKANAADFHDIVHGTCGLPTGLAFHAVKGWDKCTGVGTPNGAGGK
jgi:kumamolisin